MFRGVWGAMLSVIAWLAVFAVTGCSSAPPADDARERAATTSQAYTSNATVSWTGGKAASSCSAGVCGGDYACSDGSTGAWNGGQKTFADPTPAGSPAPTSVTVSIYAAGCASGAVTVSLNGTVLGSYNSTTTACGCGTCDPTQAVTFTNAGGLPGYVKGGANTLTIGASATICVDRATISLSGADIAQLSPSPGALPFGNQLVGAQSAAQNVIVTNTGNAQLTITSATLAAPFVLTAAPPLPANVAPNASVTFSVAFAPTGTGNASGSLAFASNDPAGNKTVALSGTGVAPSIGGTPNPLDFGNVAIATSSTQNVTLSNPGAATLTVSGLALQGANAAEFALVSAPNLPATIAPNGTLLLPMKFAPTGHGARAAQLVVTSDAYQMPAYTVSITGAGVGAKMGVAPTSVDFGTTNVNVATGAKSVTIQNTGETPLSITGVTFSGADASDFSTSTALPLTIAAGSSAQLSLGFKPTAVGARTGTATITSNDPIVPTAQVALSGNAVSPSLAVDPTSIDFGDVRAGSTSSAKQVSLTNTGTGTLTVSALTLGGPDAARFAVTGLALPAQIGAGQTAKFNVTFSPTAVASSTAHVTVASNDASNPSVVVALKGNGVSPSIALRPTSLDFGGQIVGRASKSRSAEVLNTGTATLRITTLTISGTDAAAFAQVNAPQLPATIPLNGKLTLTLTFTPTTMGDATAQLSIGNDDPSTPSAILGLKGVGVSNVLNVTPTSLDFGTLKVGTKSGAKQGTISNVGGDPIDLADGTLSGTSASDYSVTSVSGTIAPGQSVMASVTFHPGTAGPSSANLKLAPSDPSVPSAVVSLAGHAISSLLALDPTQLTFGHVTIGAKSDPKAVTVTNQSTGPLQVATVVSDNVDFVVDASNVGALAPGQTATFTVVYAPSTDGDSAARIALTLQGAPAAEIAAFASGTGDAPPSAGGSSSSSGCGCRAAGSAPPRAPVVPVAIAAIAIGARRRRRNALRR